MSDDMPRVVWLDNFYWYDYCSDNQPEDEPWHPYIRRTDEAVQRARELVKGHRDGPGQGGSVTIGDMMAAFIEQEFLHGAE